MSLEQQLAENTAALRAHVALLERFFASSATLAAVAQQDAAPAQATAGNEQPAGAPAPAPRTRKPRADATTAAPAASTPTAEAAPAAAPSTTGGEPAAKGDGTRYFFVEKNDAIFARKPTDPAVNVAGAVELTLAEFEAHQLRLAAKYGNDQRAAAQAQEPAATPAAAPAEADPFADDADPFGEPAKAFDWPEVLAKLQAVAKHPGAGVAKVRELIAPFGTTNVPALEKIGAGKYPAIVAACDAVLAA